MKWAEKYNFRPFHISISQLRSPPNLFASVTMVSFAAYSSLQSNENVSLSDMAMENVEALAQDINPLCPNRCVDPPEGQCLCNGIWYKLTEFDWGTGGSPIE